MLVHPSPKGGGLSQSPTHMRCREGDAAHGAVAAAGGPSSPGMSSEVAGGGWPDVLRDPRRAHMAWRAAHEPNAT